MSAYLVADETINRVVEWFSWEVTKDPFLKEQLEDTLGIDTTVYQWFVQLGQDMFVLNIAGVEARYGGGAARRFRERNYSYTPAHGSEIQVLKSLQCWLYQCRERDVVKRPLYKFFRDVVEPYLMSSIINDLPEYNRAVWGKRTVLERAGVFMRKISIHCYSCLAPVTRRRASRYCPIPVKAP